MSKATENMKNEVMVINEKKQIMYVDRFNKAVAGCNKSAWQLAKVIYDTVKAKDFEEAFGTLTNYAKAIEFDKSTITKSVKSYEKRMALVAHNEDLGKLLRGQVEEFNSLDVDTTIEIIEEYKINEKTPQKSIREIVKAWKEAEETADSVDDIIDEAEETADSAEDNADIEETEKETMFISYNGTDYEITDLKVIDKILALLK